MRRVLVAACVLGALALPGRAAAADECRGLDVCISVPGPWVVVPAAGSGTRTVSYRLACPRNAIAAGTDAVKGDAGIEVKFLGATGSPVSPGVTTEREVWFVAVWAGRRATTFRPFLGCVPTAGGGRSTTARAPQYELTRRARNFPIGAATLGAFGCRADERLVGATFAVAFRMSAKPRPALLSGVRVRLTRRGGRIVANVRQSLATIDNDKGLVQLQVLCARR